MVTAIILSGGRGKRLGAGISKQYVKLQGKPILQYTINQFMKNSMVDKIILVLPKDEIDYCKTNVIDKYGLKIDKIVSGGSERSESVYNALTSISNTDTVLIHDGARPFVSQQIINNAIKYSQNYKAAAPGVVPKDTIKVRGSNGFSKETLERDKLVAIQTPQAFDYKMILEAHRKIRLLGISVTDDTSVIEKIGKKVFLFDGEYNNIKITTADDLILGEYLAKL